MKGRCFDMSAVAQLLKKPFKTPWSPPAFRGKTRRQARTQQNQTVHLMSTSCSSRWRHCASPNSLRTLSAGVAIVDAYSSRLRPCNRRVGHTLQCNSWESDAAAFLSSAQSDELCSGGQDIMYRKVSVKIFLQRSARCLLTTGCVCVNAR